MWETRYVPFQRTRQMSNDQSARRYLANDGRCVFFLAPPRGVPERRAFQDLSLQLAGASCGDKSWKARRSGTLRGWGRGGGGLLITQTYPAHLHQGPRAQRSALPCLALSCLVLSCHCPLLSVSFVLCPLPVVLRSWPCPCYCPLSLVPCPLPLAMCRPLSFRLDLPICMCVYACVCVCVCVCAWPRSLGSRV
jgi:hypothetical protein